MYETPPNKHSSLIYIALVCSWVIILGGIWFVFFRDQPTSVDTDTENTDEQTVRYFIGEQVMLEGTLTMSDDLSQYSHILTTKNNMKFGIKSFDIALNTYTGMVQLRGEVTGFKQQIPIVQASDVIGMREDGTVTGTTGTSSYTYVASANLGIDLSAFPGYTINQEGDEIQLFDDIATKLITISSFTCTPGDSLKDCTVLQNALQASSRFTNAAGMSFANFPETERRMTFDGNRKGYVLTAEADTVLQTYASIFEIVDPAQFALRLEEMKGLCRDINSRLTTITTHEAIIDPDGSVQIGIDGSTSAGVAASCVVSTTLADTARLSLVSYTGPTSPEDPTSATPPTAPTTPPVTTTGTSTPPTVSVPAEYASWTTYPSVRGWTMYVERNVISYFGVILTGAADVNCPYRLELSNRTNATGAAADSFIYECLPVGATSLKSQGYTTVGVATGVEFVRKDLTPSLQDIDVYIQ